jgi:restriction endonuclease S subunit
MGETVARRAFAVTFQMLDRWGVAYFRSVKWQWPKEFIHPIGTALNRIQEIVSTDLIATPIIEKISFGGELTILDEEKRSGYKGRLFKAKSGQLIYSKIRVKQGSVCIVPPSIDWVAVSSEYPVYEINSEEADPKYLDLVLRSTAFKHYLDGLSHGGSTKTRIHPDQFEELSIPIPPLPVQQQIVAHWETAQTSLQRNLEAISRSKQEAFDIFRKALGIITSSVTRPKLFTAQWREVERWGHELAWKNKNGANSLVYPIKPLKEVCKTGSGGTPSRKHKEYYGGEIPWVKTTEVRNVVIYDTEEKITSKGLSSSSAKLYPAGSLVIAMYGQGATRGRTAKLGVDAATNQACLVLTDIDSTLDTDFLWYYLMVSYDEMRGLASGNNQPNLSADLLGGFPIPIPPATKQAELKTLFEIAQQKVAELKEQSAQIRNQTTRDIEKMILGNRSVED